jgi:hypothetical protein
MPLESPIDARFRQRMFEEMPGGYAHFDGELGGGRRHGGKIIRGVVGFRL